MRASIVVPMLNEAARIESALAALQPLRAAGHEVIVVDGGSADGTLALARPLVDRALAALPGRATQMNAGAAAATGDVLLFLHADTRLPVGGLDSMIAALVRTGRRWGRFDVAISGKAWVLTLVAALMNRRSRLTGIATGDQGIFVERALFDAVGGFPDQPLMEDVELSKRLVRAAGRPICLDARVVTSGRRWESQGPWRTIAAMWWLRFLYWRGADPRNLACRYDTLTADAPSMPPPTLQIFAREPVPGTVKTRLARVIGAQAATDVHVRLVERTLATAVAARAAGVVDRVELWCTPDADRPAFVAWRDRYRVTLMTQRGDELGARMRDALHTALARGSRALLVGTDIALLDVDYLAAAAAALADHDAVFGPAEDGGYVLAGLARAVDPFAGVAWGSPGVMAATRANLMSARATWRELPVLWDVDTADDLARWEALTASPLAEAAAAV
ncbi:MAG: TIGR04283 family arsenosugar biosynthesis glycosyltransferase [Betaproteobacteria bacterium]